MLKLFLSLSAEQTLAITGLSGASVTKCHICLFRHGGWWAAKEFRHISGPIAIELGDNSYIRALDDGTFTVGAPHNDGNVVIYYCYRLPNGL